jgi:hypothetical protein
MPNFGFAAITPQQLAHILDSNPNRKVQISTGLWSAEQSLVFATRPYLLNLYFESRHTDDGFYFEDDGTQFVDALGSVHFICSIIPGIAIKCCAVLQM